MSDAPLTPPPVPALLAALPARAPVQAATQQFPAFATELDEALSIALGEVPEPATGRAGERQTAAGEGNPLPFPFPFPPPAIGERMPAADAGQAPPVDTALATSAWAAAAGDPATPPAVQPSEPAEAARPRRATAGHGSISWGATVAGSPAAESAPGIEAMIPAHPGSTSGQPVADAAASHAILPSIASPATAAPPATTAFAPVAPGEPVSAPERAPASAAPLPLDAPDWEPVLAERVAWQIGERVQSARLEINPPELGPLEVRVRFEGEQARVHLVADTPAARDALDSGVPRLRELLGQAGIGLLDVSVERHAGGSREPRFYAPPAADPAADAQVPAPAARAVGLVDYYA